MHKNISEKQAPNLLRTGQCLGEDHTIITIIIQIQISLINNLIISFRIAGGMESEYPQPWTARLIITYKQSNGLRRPLECVGALINRYEM